MTIVDQSSTLGTHIEFNLEHLCQIPELPNLGDHCYLTAYGDLTTYGRTETEAYTAITNAGAKPR